jgi:hypothetical protein
MECLICHTQLSCGQAPSYSHSWKQVGGICQKVTICLGCFDQLEDCLPTESEEKQRY